MSAVAFPQVRPRRERIRSGSRKPSQRVIAESRLTAWQSEAGAPFAYAGKVMQPTQAGGAGGAGGAGLSPAIARGRELLRARMGRAYDSCLINYYPDAKSGMRFHADPGQGDEGGWGWEKRAVSPICGARRHSVFSHMSADLLRFTGFSTAVVSVGDPRRFVFRQALTFARFWPVVSTAVFCEKRELISDIWGKRGVTYGGKGVCRCFVHVSSDLCALRKRHKSHAASLTRQVSRSKSHEAILTKQVSRSKSHETSLTCHVCIPFGHASHCSHASLASLLPPPPILLPIVPSRRTEDVSDRCTFLLRAGDVVEMWGECQQQYQHSVLVEAAAELARPRISLVYKRTLEAEQRLSPGERPEWDDHAAQGLKSPWGGELEQPTWG